MPTNTGKAALIGSTVVGTGAAGFLSGIAAIEGAAAVICPPCGIILGGAMAIGAGLGIVGKAIFG